MRITIIIQLVVLMYCCCDQGVSIKAKDRSKINGKSALYGKDTFVLSKPTNIELTDSIMTLTVSYAAIECGCPQWFETRYGKIPFLEGVEKFYLEPINEKLVNANDLWDGQNLPLTVKVVGRFSKVKGVPVTYHVKGEPEKARIFWYNKITHISPVYRRAK
jgi:hypothetical protein